MAGDYAGTNIRQSCVKAAMRTLMGLGKMPHCNVNLSKSLQVSRGETLCERSGLRLSRKGRLHLALIWLAPVAALSNSRSSFLCNNQQ